MLCALLSSSPSYLLLSVTIHCICGHRLAPSSPHSLTIMRTLTVILFTLATLLLPIAAVPAGVLASRQEGLNSPNLPVCAGTSSPAGTGVSMQTYCIDTIGARCALVVVFPSSTGSGNPGNCGNACSCSQSVRVFGPLSLLF